MTHLHLSKLKGRLSFKVCPDVEKVALVRKRATNDSAESTFSSFTHQLVTYNTIDLHTAAGTADMKCNDYYFQPTTKKHIKEKVNHGMMFCINPNLRDAIMKTAMEEAPRVKKENIQDLENQQQARRDKE